MKILTILGARPQFIKASSVSRAISSRNGITEIIVHTGQHYDTNMSDIFFNEMKIPKPDYNLNINRLGHGAMTGQMLEKIEEVLLKEKPDWVIVYGDTNSTIAGALASAKLHIKVAHVEAGLRSFNTNMPEEVNRIITDRISNVLFCPTQSAIDNLEKEGFPFKLANSSQQHIHNVGDVMQDGAIFYKDLAVKPQCNISNEYILCTIHRAENTDDIVRLSQIIEALNHINKFTQVILPLHPRTKQIIEKNYIPIDFTIIEPIGYLEMIWLINNCNFVMTDSGGLQKEAYFFKKPCIILRDETEWVELVENNFNTLAGASKSKIIDAVNNISNMNKDFDINLYGDGNASQKIIEELLK